MTIATAPALLPGLRQELRLLPGQQTGSGKSDWMIFDPVRNAYRKVSERAFVLLQLWREEPTEKLRARAGSVLDDPVSDDEIRQLAEFLYQNGLTREPPGNDPAALKELEASQQKPLWQRAIHNYLFFRAPLFQPDRFLKATYPVVAPFFHHNAWLALGLLFLGGLYLVSQQWNSFTATFLHFLSFEGMIFYGLTMLVIKSVHELGHAWAAHHFRCRVPVIGVAFLVMFPVLYTDTTNAWSLPERKKRLLIDAGGLAAELVIAVLSLLLWAFLPDGPWRSAAFFAATTSLGLSLLINLNPFMRFDGYYLLSDLCGISNLQEKGFAIGRWRLRNLLFGLKAPAPFSVSPATRAGLTFYAWGTWIYRSFLFVGIALFLHAVFPRAIGIVLFVVEIAWFLGKPIADEAKNWWGLRQEIVASRRGRLTLLVWGGLLFLLFLPLNRAVHAPALLQPVATTDIHSVFPAKVETIHVRNGDIVEKGSHLFTLSSPDLALQQEQTALRIDLLKVRLARRVSNRQELADSDILLRELNSEETRLAGLLQLQRDLGITAPHGGVISGLQESLHEGRWVSPDFRLGVITSPDTFEIIAFPPETEVDRIKDQAPLVFVPDDAFLSPVRGRVEARAAVAEAYLASPLLSSAYKGPVAVREDDRDGRQVPVGAILKLEAQPQSLPPTPRQLRGKVKIAAAPESAANAIRKSVSRVLIREADF